MVNITRKTPTEQTYRKMDYLLITFNGINGFTDGLLNSCDRLLMFVFLVSPFIFTQVLTPPSH